MHLQNELNYSHWIKTWATFFMTDAFVHVTTKWGPLGRDNRTKLVWSSSQPIPLSMWPIEAARPRQENKTRARENSWEHLEILITLKPPPHPNFRHPHLPPTCPHTCEMTINFFSLDNLLVVCGRKKKKSRGANPTYVPKISWEWEHLKSSFIRFSGTLGGLGPRIK